MSTALSILGPDVLAALPNVAKVRSIKLHGESAWAKAMRIDAEDNHGIEVRYFMKISTGESGRAALAGEFESTAAIFNIAPDFCPEPITWGTLKSQPESHFYICKYYDFTDGVPEPISFCEKLARLHSHQAAPEGKFGFQCTTYNGNIPQDNTWCDSWESFFSHGLRHVIKIHEERAGPSAELEALTLPLFEKVIPRLLRPLETGGRIVKPSLVHGDLWCGNASIIDENTEEGITYDPSSFWAHNEYELGNWRPERNKFTRRYFQAYHSHIPKAEPEEDYDDRNALYAIRFNMHAAAMFPDQRTYLQTAIEEIARLVAAYPAGFIDTVAGRGS